jgi:succinate dehydrogenase flavin-adding protein (antitoxin of CptAB toxin-antitoxin module)
MLVRSIERHSERPASFQALLIYTDTDIPDSIGARAECHDARLAQVVGRLRDSCTVPVPLVRLMSDY